MRKKNVYFLAADADKKRLNFISAFVQIRIEIEIGRYFYIKNWNNENSKEIRKKTDKKPRNSIAYDI